jgi:hypothetical protein
MTVKTSGAEFKAFYEDKTIWPDHLWHEEETIMVDGVELDIDIDIDIELPFPSVKSTSVVTISGGIVYGSWAVEDAPSFETYFKRWREAQNTVFFMVQCPKDKAKSIQAVIKLNEGKIL